MLVGVQPVQALGQRGSGCGGVDAAPRPMGDQIVEQWPDTVLAVRRAARLSRAATTAG